VNDGQSIDTIWLVGGLVLAVSALMAQRATLGGILRALLGWAIVGGLIWAALTHREQIETAVNLIAERVGMGEQTVVGETVRITLAPDGHFWARATINGRPKRMLIDSGATITAISADTARKAGIEVGSGGLPVLITTANGTVTAQRARIERLKVGSLTTDDLGVVVAPNFGNVDVLGMNFLQRLGSWRVEGRTLILEPKPRKSST
jgi:aspartyl protease family protein